MRTLLLLLLALPAVPSAFAQAAAAPADPTARISTEFLGAQLATLLRDADRRRDGLDLTLQLAAARPDVDLTATVDPLLAIYRGDADAQHRRAAAVALARIGDRTGMERLAELSRYESDAVLRQATAQLLAAYVEALPSYKADALTFTVETE